MRYLSLLLLSLLLVFNTSAQKKFSQKDFNKLKQLTMPWLVQSNSDLPVYEKWQSINDSLLGGTWYRVADDTNYLPEADIKLYYADYKITLAGIFTEKNNEAGATYTFELTNIDKDVYFFDNTAASLSGEGMTQLQERVLINIAYDFSKKDGITAQRKYIVPGKGLQTVRYVFKKDQTKKSAN